MGHEEIEILLVEDNLHDAEMTIRSLQKNKLANNVVHLKDGASAYDFLMGKREFEMRDINQKPKLILLDLKMPKMDGIELLEIIKGDPRTKKIPVVVLTSSKEDPDIEKCYQLGVNSYIVKPVDFENFSRIVSELSLYWILTNQHPT